MEKPTVVIRHRLENLRKCSLSGLEGREDFCFFTYPYESLPDFSGYIVLTLDGPELSGGDRECGLLVIDATWRYAAKMFVPFAGQPHFLYRSLPSHYRTAYPRRQSDCVDPSRGLASVEAIFLSYYILGRNTEGLLDRYYWKDQFLEMNQLT